MLFWYASSDCGTFFVLTASQFPSCDVDRNERKEEKEKRPIVLVNRVNESGGHSGPEGGLLVSLAGNKSN